MEGKTTNAMRCNNHDDLLHVGVILKNSIFSDAYFGSSQTAQLELVLQKYLTLIHLHLARTPALPILWYILCYNALVAYPNFIKLVTFNILEFFKIRAGCCSVSTFPRPHVMFSVCILLE